MLLCLCNRAFEYSASNILVVILSLELDTRPQLTLVSPELTLGLKFGPSWIYYPTCPKSWILERKVRVFLGREIQLLRSHLSGSERVGRGDPSKCKYMRTRLKIAFLKNYFVYLVWNQTGLLIKYWIEYLNVRY